MVLMAAAYRAESALQDGACNPGDGMKPEHSKSLESLVVGVIGLGYVGLPLATELGRQYRTIAYDIDAKRVAELREGRDHTREVTSEALAGATRMELTYEPEPLADCDVIIVTVPTPIDDFKRPDLGPLTSASRAAGKVLREGAIVVFESTVYPGATEEVCAPLIAEASGLALNEGFYLGYSPERINPGDPHRRLPDIVKVTSGSTPEVADFVDRLYGSIIRAGTHRASSIRVAEAAKVIENTQRDVNIALINELALLFHRMGIDTGEVLEAASTKWNFLPFRPGLVGGHCVGVDPFYLTHKAQQVGHHPEIILAGRRINDSMGVHVASRVVKLLERRRIPVAGSRVLIMGLAFKENCPDLRNTRVIDIVRELEDFGADVVVHDPWADADETHREYGLSLCDQPKAGRYDAIVIAVAHRQFAELGAEGIRALAQPGGIIFDVKHLLPAAAVDGRL
jgi:UDP-N-acetyl-D-glucosamine/UDP-N-acetyl-D-galactosamine dehydrogenase